MTGNSITFEVHVYNAGHWVMDQRFHGEAEARKHGKKLLTNPKCAGYRIVRNWQKPPGRHFETEIISEFRPLDDTLIVTPIEDAPVCITDIQYYEIESRMTIGRLLRGYIERTVVTPTEILHNYDELRRLLDRNALVPAALSRVASLQSAKTGSESHARRDEITQTLGRIVERARSAAAQTDLPDPKVDGLAKVYRTLNQRLPADDAAHTCLVALSRDLVQMRNWLFKLDFLIDLLENNQKENEPEGRLEAASLLDGICADILGAPPVLPLLLGPQRALLDTLNQTADLCQGRLAAAGLPGEHRLARLNAALNPAVRDSRTLSQCQASLFDQIRRQIKGTHPLAATGGDSEEDAFRALLLRLTDVGGVLGGGVLGGGAMAEALTIRFGRTLETGGASGRRQAITGMLAHYPDAAGQVRYLLSLSDSDLGRQHAADVVEHLQTLFEQAPDAAPFIAADRPLAESLGQVSALYDLTLGSALEAGERRRLAGVIDGLLARYLVDHRVVDQFGQPDEPLRDRANRLVRLCIPGTLRSPRALGTLRTLVIEHLRQPDFDASYTRGLLGPAARQQALREFHALLSAAGFC